VEEWLSLGINKVHGKLSKEKVIVKQIENRQQAYSFCASIPQCFSGSSGVDLILHGKRLYLIVPFEMGPEIILGSEHFLHVL
jgi:hypothetical protein